MANKKILTSEKIKNWKYAKGHMLLSFSIDARVKTDLVDFLDLLKAATLEIEREIKEYKSA